MAVTIGVASNISSLRAQRALNSTTASVARAYERLSSGLRINSASDDAAGLSVASSLKAESRVFQQAIRNANDGISLLNITEGALSELTGISLRQRELATQAANGAYNLTQRRALDAEANALVDEFNRIVRTTSFNGISPLSGSGSTTTLQLGSGTSATLSVSLGSDLARRVGSFSFTQSGSGTAFAADQAVVGDFNHDGYEDRVAVGTGGNTLTIALGNSDGTFGMPRSFHTGGTWLNALAVGDLDSDNVLDLAVADYYNATVTVFRGDDRAGFTLQATVAMPAHYSLAIEDVNDDGIGDLVTYDGFGYPAYTTNSTSRSTEVARLNLLSSSGAQLAMEVIDSTLDRISAETGKIGAAQSRLAVAVSNLASTRENYEAAAARVLDADIAAETSNLVRLQVLQQAGASVLAQANLQPQLALRLLQT